nr:MAG: hypothetical protein DIU72_12430 [Pseudomonadota bacterium]
MRAPAARARDPPPAPARRETLVRPGGPGQETGAKRVATAGPFVAVVIEFYVPPSETDEGVVRVAETAYRPLLQALEEERESAAVTVALDPALALRLLSCRQSGVLHAAAALAESGTVEFAAGSRNHALLPRLPRAEVDRQLEKGDELMRELLGWSWRPKGLFPPALAYGRRVAEAAAARGLRWLLLDEISLGRIGAAPTHFIATLGDGHELCLFFRSRDLSSAFLRSNGRTLRKHLESTLGDGYGVLVVPAESFTEGSQALQNLRWLLSRPGPMPATVSALLPLFPERRRVEPIPASRRTTGEDLAMGIPFSAWSSPDNELQALLWKLAALAWTEAARLAERSPDAPETRRLRANLDEGLHSAAFRQASSGAAFRPEAVRAAADRLSCAIESGGNLVSEEVRRKTASAYQRLLRTLDERARAGDAPTPK